MDIRVAAYGVIVAERFILLTHWHEGRKWSLPGGGVEEREQPVDAAIREIREETGFTAAVGGLLSVDSIVIPGPSRHGVRSAPLHSFRIVYEAMVVSGELAHEIGGSSDQARWVALDDVEALPRVGLVDIALGAWRAKRPTSRTH